MCLNEDVLKKLIPPGTKLEDFAITPKQAEGYRQKGNQNLSKKLQIFQEVNVVLLKTIRGIKGDPTHYKGEKAQVLMTPDGGISLGFFYRGSGTCIKSNPVEGIDFKFI